MNKILLLIGESIMAGVATYAISERKSKSSKKTTEQINDKSDDSEEDIKKPKRKRDEHGRFIKGELKSKGQINVTLMEDFKSKVENL